MGTDSWVGRTEMELFGEMQEKGLVPDDDMEDDRNAAQSLSAISDEDEEDADDEFAEDDFADDAFDVAPRQEGFGPNAFSSTELDGWVLDETPNSELAGADG